MSTMDTGESLPAMRTIARGIELSPELKDGCSQLQRGQLPYTESEAAIFQ